MRKVRDMAKECSYTNRNQGCTKDNGRTIGETAMDTKDFQMEAFMRVNSLITDQKEVESINGLMGKSTTVSSREGRKMGMVCGEVFTETAI